jgi:hypothetical protein
LKLSIAIVQYSYSTENHEGLFSVKLWARQFNSAMPRANGPDELLYSLIELRPGDAKRRFRKSIFEDYFLRGPFGQCACAYCGEWKEKLTIDHVMPKSKGGPHFSKFNLVPACRACNLSKGNENLFEWWRPQQFWTEKREEILMAWVYCNSFVSAHTDQKHLEEWCEKKGIVLPMHQTIEHEKAPLWGLCCNAA